MHSDLRRGNSQPPSRANKEGQVSTGVARDVQTNEDEARERSSAHFDPEVPTGVGAASPELPSVDATAEASLVGIAQLAVADSHVDPNADASFVGIS